MNASLEKPLRDVYASEEDVCGSEEGKFVRMLFGVEVIKRSLTKRPPGLAGICMWKNIRPQGGVITFTEAIK